MMNAEGKSTMKRFSCSFCEYSTDKKSNFIAHERTHTGEKPFKCKHCDKSFAQRSTLIKHERTHTSEKPFSCKKCNKPFTRNDNCKLHEKKCLDHTITEIKEESTTESDILNEFMYNPANEVYHNVTDTTGNPQMLSQSENICEETVFIAVDSNQDVKEEINYDVKTECFP